MNTINRQQLSRRERQIMDIIYERGESSARDIHGALPEAPSYSTVRALLTILVDKGHATHRQEGAKYLYSPAQPVEQVRQGAVSRLIKTFFRGSVGAAATALLGQNADQLSDNELDELSQLIERAREKRK
jgi:predicted transcriptional regulator